MDHGVVLLAAFAGGAVLFILTAIYKATRTKAPPPEVVVIESKPVESDEASLQQMVGRAGRPAEPLGPICTPACGNPRCMLCFGGDGSKEKLGNVKFDLLAINSVEEIERARARAAGDRGAAVLDAYATPEEPPLLEPIVEDLAGLHKNGPDLPAAKKTGEEKNCGCPLGKILGPPKERYYYNTVVKDANGDIKPVVLQMGKALHDKLFRGVLDGVEADYFKPSSPLERMQRVRSEKAKANKPEVDDWFRPQDGVFTIRFLPAAPSLLKTKMACVSRKQHYLGGYGKGNVIACPKRKGADGKWHGECPICDHWKHLWAMSDIAGKKGEHKRSEEYRKQATQIKGMERHYYNVLIYEPGGVVRGPLIYSAGIQVQTMIERLSKGEVGEVGGVGEEGSNYELFDPMMAHNCKLRRTVRHTYGGHAGYPNFDLMAASEAKPIGDDSYTEAVLANMWDLEVVADQWVKTTEEMKQALIDNGFHPIVQKKCKACDDRIDSSRDDVQFCKASCLMLHKARLIEKSHYGCPQCGETATKLDGATLKYACGFQSDASRVNSKCKAFPACTCSASKISELPRGCKCGARCEIVAQQPKETVVYADDDFLAELAKM